MTDASGPAYCSMLLPSRFRKDDRMLYVAILQQTYVSPYQAFGKMGGGAGDVG